MRCEEIMKIDVRCASPSESVRSAALRMRDDNVGFLPICDQDGQVLGTLTDRDIAMRVDAAGLSAVDCLVADVMTSEVVFCRPEDDVATAERLMAQHRKSRIVIVDENDRICGVISLSDIAIFDGPRRAADTMRQIASREVRL